jgi:NADH-quinone oxidoreductase subunit K
LDVEPNRGMSFDRCLRNNTGDKRSEPETGMWRKAMPLSAYLIVSAVLFTIGVLGVMLRRNPLIIFMSIELMLNAVNLSFVALSHFLDSADGQMFVFVILTVAAAEVVVGLALIVSIFRTRRNIDVDEMNVLRG